MVVLVVERNNRNLVVVVVEGKRNVVLVVEGNNRNVVVVVVEGKHIYK